MSGVFDFVALEFQIIVIAKDTFVPFMASRAPSSVSFQNFGGNFARNKLRRLYEGFDGISQGLRGRCVVCNKVRQPRRATHEFYEIFVSVVVFGEHNG